MSESLIREFRPTIIFLIKFLVIYLLGNILYGLYITHYHPEVDPVTHLISVQAAYILGMGGDSITYQDYANHASTLIVENGKTVLSIYEGCNGLNTMIIFTAFLLAFGPISKRLFWFMPLGILIIYFFNHIRIILLYWVVKHQPDALYFTHKYLFTGFLFAVILALWIWWIRKFANANAGAAQ